MASVVISDIINRSWYYRGARWRLNSFSRLSFWWSVSRSFHKSMHWQSHEKTFLSISMTFLRHYIEFLPVYIVSRHLLWQYQLYAKKLWYTKAWSCIVFCKEQLTCQRDRNHPYFYYTWWQFSDMQYLFFICHGCPIYSRFLWVDANEIWSKLHNTVIHPSYYEKASV